MNLNPFFKPKLKPETVLLNHSCPSGHNGLGANATHVLGHPEYRSCVVAHYPPPTQAYPRLETEEPCPQSLPGLCMRKLARGCAER